jgi:hypothetical protein
VEGGHKKVNSDYGAGCSKPILSFDKFLKRIETQGEDYVYRAQYNEWPLETTLERAFNSAGFNNSVDRKRIESNMIRDFKRIYDGEDKSKVQSDTLYCMSVMRHYGAPTRLLDCTRSAYAAAYFALEYAYDNIPTKKGSRQLNYTAFRDVAVWCFSVHELNKAAQIAYEHIPEFNIHFHCRFIDEQRTDESFNPLYMENKYDLVIQENPLKMHRRLHLQQGAFLCPGNINKSFEENLNFIPAQNRSKAIVRIVWRANQDEIKNASNKCFRMNMTRESLFPGLDGYASSMKYQLDFYKRLGEQRAKYGME